MYAVILIPNFELQCALRGEPAPVSTPVALIGETLGTTVPSIRQTNEAASTAGVNAGMSLPQAQARCAELVFRRTHSQQEAVATTAILQAADRVSPFLENTAPGCCTLDLRRSGELDHVLWANDLVTEMQLLDLQAQVGVGPTPDAAVHAAQLARPVLVTNDPLQRLAELPILVLSPSQRIVEILYDWGIERVADLRALDRQQVAERLGLEGIALWDRAAGGLLRPLRLVRPAETYRELAEFEGGVETLEPVLFRLRRALEQLTRRVRADLLLVGATELILDFDDRTKLARTIHIPAPTCEVDVLFRILSTYLDTVEAKSPVVTLHLEAFSSMPRDHQTHLWEGSLRDPNGFSETLARLSGIVGAAHVGTPRRLTTHRPDSFRLEEAAFDADKPLSSSRSRVSKGTSQAIPPVFLPIGPGLRRYRPPWRVTVETDGRRPIHLVCPGLEGEIHVSNGPWRLDGDWWEAETAWRWEEWDIEMAKGGLYRLANHRQANWWMLGMYD